MIGFGKEDVSPAFIGMCLNAIDTMKKKGFDEALIAITLVEIRNAALQENDMRLKTLHAENPPPMIKPSEILKYFDTFSK